MLRLAFWCYVPHACLQKQRNLFSRKFEALAIRQPLCRHRIFRATRIYTSNLELISTSAEFAPKIAGRKAKGFSQCLKAQLLRIQRGAIRQRYAKPEANITAPAQVNVAYAQRLQHQPVL